MGRGCTSVRPRDFSLTAFLLARAWFLATFLSAKNFSRRCFAFATARAGSRRLCCRVALGAMKRGERLLPTLMLFGHEAGAGLRGKREAGLVRAMLSGGDIVDGGS